MTIFLYMTHCKKEIIQHDNFFVYNLTRNFFSNFTENKKCMNVAIGSIYGPFLISLKRWGRLRRQGLCSHLTHLWDTSDFVPCYEAGHSTAW